MENNGDLKRINAALSSMYGFEMNSYDGEWDWIEAMSRMHGNTENKAVDVAIEFCSVHGITPLDARRDVGIQAVKNLEPVCIDVLNGSVEVRKYNLDSEKWMVAGVYPDGGLGKCVNKFLTGEKANVRQANIGEQGYAVAVVENNILMIGRDGAVMRTADSRGDVELGRWVEMSSGGVKPVVPAVANNGASRSYEPS